MTFPEKRDIMTVSTAAPGLIEMYQAYIDGRKELREINMEYNAWYTRGEVQLDRDECSYSGK